MTAEPNPYSPPCSLADGPTADLALRSKSSTIIPVAFCSIQFFTAGILTFFTCLYLSGELVQWHRVEPFLWTIGIVTLALHAMSLLTSRPHSRKFALGFVPYVIGSGVVVVLFMLGWYPSSI